MFNTMYLISLFFFKYTSKTGWVRLLCFTLEMGYPFLLNWRSLWIYSSLIKHSLYLPKRKYLYFSSWDFLMCRFFIFCYPPTDHSLRTGDWIIVILDLWYQLVSKICEKNYGTKKDFDRILYSVLDL